MQLVAIKWVDSHSPSLNAWIDESEIDHSPQIIRTVGWVINKNRTSITVASQITGKGSSQVAGVITIPKCCIKKQREIQEV
ncbi:MAG: hypothetical protein AAF449_13360 [Myxococcota bacterium]